MICGSDGILAKPTNDNGKIANGSVHLFIGIGRSLCKFTFMPFIFTVDSWINQRGLNSLFPFRSVPFSAT